MQYTDLNPVRKNSLGLAPTCDHGQMFQRWHTLDGKRRFLEFVNHYIQVELQLDEPYSLEWSAEIQTHFLNTIGAVNTRRDSDVIQGAYHMAQILSNRTRMTQRLTQCQIGKVPQMNWTNEDRQKDELEYSTQNTPFYKSYMAHQNSFLE